MKQASSVAPGTHLEKCITLATDKEQGSCGEKRTRPAHLSSVLPGKPSMRRAGIVLRRESEHSARSPDDVPEHSIAAECVCEGFALDGVLNASQVRGCSAGDGVRIA